MFISSVLQLKVVSFTTNLNRISYSFFFYLQIIYFTNTDLLHVYKMKITFVFILIDVIVLY
jgi:hypothetical protein